MIWCDDMIQYNIMLYYIILYYMIQYNVILYYIILYYIINTRLVMLCVNDSGKSDLKEVFYALKRYKTWERSDTAQYIILYLPRSDSVGMDS